MECGFESLRFEIQPGRGGHFWCGSGDVVWRRLGGNRIEWNGIERRKK
jgi:hypothetical protein